MNQPNKLSRQDIQTKYLNKPILITDDENTKKWYIVSDTNTTMPLHLLTEEESDLYDQDESNIEGIEVAGVDGNGFLMRIHYIKLIKMNCNVIIVGGLDISKMIMIPKRIGMKKGLLMKIKVIRNCKSCIYHYWKDLEDDQCYEKGGCLQFSPVGLRLEYVEIIIEIMSDKPKHSLDIFYDV